MVNATILVPPTGHFLPRPGGVRDAQEEIEALRSASQSSKKRSRTSPVVTPPAPGALAQLIKLVSDGDDEDDNFVVELPSKNPHLHSVGSCVRPLKRANLESQPPRSVLHAHNPDGGFLCRNPNGMSLPPQLQYVKTSQFASQKFRPLCPFASN